MKDISTSKWLDPAFVDQKIKNNADKAKRDREQLVLRGKIAKNYTRARFARVAK